MDLGLRDRVFVVGGGSAGLGLATASVLVAEGARVVLAARDGERLAAACAFLGPASAETVACDLAEAGSAPRLVEAALSRFGRLDGALCNVGGPAPSTPLGTDDEAWRAAFERAFLAPVRLARVVAEHLRSERGDGGALCFVLSTSARVPIPGLAGSNGLRPGLAGHVVDLAAEVGPPPRSVRVTGVLPGTFSTDRQRETDPDGEGARAYAARTPLRRTGDPVELGRVAAFLLSPAASFVTGTCVTVDGGATRAL